MIDGTCKPGFERVAEAFQKNFDAKRRGRRLGLPDRRRRDGGRPVGRHRPTRRPARRGRRTRSASSSPAPRAPRRSAPTCWRAAASSTSTRRSPSCGRSSASNGKERATTRMMLDHSVGVPALRAKVKDSGPYEWDYMTARLADEEPFWEPGTRNGYHGFTFGWTVGEMVRRAAGKSLGTFFQDEIAKPLGLDFWIGLPEAIEPRVAPIIPYIYKAERGQDAVHDRPRRPGPESTGVAVLLQCRRLAHRRRQHARRPRRRDRRGQRHHQRARAGRHVRAAGQRRRQAGRRQDARPHGRGLDGDARRRHLAHPDALCAGLHEVDGQPQAQRRRQAVRRRTSTA